MRNGLAEVTASFNHIFNVEELIEQYETVKLDVLQLCCALQSKGGSVEIITTHSGITVYHSFSGERVREIFTHVALSHKDIKNMKQLRLKLGSELKKINEAR